MLEVQLPGLYILGPGTAFNGTPAADDAGQDHGHSRRGLRHILVTGQKFSLPEIQRWTGAA